MTLDMIFITIVCEQAVMLRLIDSAHLRLISSQRNFRAGGILDSKRLASRSYLFNFRVTFSLPKNTEKASSLQLVAKLFSHSRR